MYNKLKYLNVTYDFYCSKSISCSSSSECDFNPNLLPCVVSCHTLWSLMSSGICGCKPPATGGMQRLSFSTVHAEVLEEISAAGFKHVKDDVE